MTEGDLIFRLAARLETAFGNRPVSEADVPGRRGPVGRPVSQLVGRRLEKAESRGKHLLLRFEGDLVLHSHLGMVGSWRLYPAGTRWDRPPTAAWLRMRAGEVEAVEFNGPTLRLAPAREIRRDRRLARVGMDVMAKEFSAARGVDALRSLDPDRQLGEALLDQGAVAGIGNLYKSEGCFAAAVSPFRRLGELSDEEAGRVLDATASLMRAGAIRAPRGRSVYKRSGWPCPRCGEPIQSRQQGDQARFTYWCPRCQG